LHLDNQEAYGYDELSRLTSVTYKDNVTQSYTFNKVGNGGRLKPHQPRPETCLRRFDLNVVQSAQADFGRLLP
jgi:hypothetical protein